MTLPVLLRDVEEGDLPVFFEQQLDPVANRMAAFTAADPGDRSAFLERWTRILRDDGITKRTVLVDGRVAGHVVCFTRLGKQEVGYWIDRSLWGMGVATKALAAFLGEVASRPLHARVACDNAASIRVLEKCGFRSADRGRAFANARGEHVEEIVYELP